MTDSTVRLGQFREYGKAHVEPLSLANGKLYVVGGSIRIDERISWYPKEEFGRYVPFNSYLLRESDETLLLESGVPATFYRMAEHIRSILGELAPLGRVAVTRNEPDCVANIPLLVRQFGLKTVHSPGLMNTLQFFKADDAGLIEDSFNHRSTELQMLNFGVSCAPAVSGAEIKVSDDRSLEIIAAPLRVLPTVWYYDRATRTMFCSDSFSDETAASVGLKFVSEVDEGEALVVRFHRHFPGKFDWLARSDLSSIIASLEDIFDRYDIETLAPNRGLVIQGKAAVEAKTAALLVALKAL